MLSTEPVIHLENVSVRFRLPKERIYSVKEFVIRWLQRRVVYHDFFALTDVNLDVMPGEVFGVIGHNGAGKSTLLKVIARVLRPTKGRVRLRGHISPLLELGAGFDPELTGRENVYLNGAILGYKKADIKKRFDRIVAFAGLEEFIDSPIRNYSTGMTSRLGFSIATDVRPEVLIVDEVLSVGDAEFQKKSKARIEEFRAKGSTILLVTHDMEVVQNMCQRVLWLEHGKVRMSGQANDVLDVYKKENQVG